MRGTNVASSKLSRSVVYERQVNAQTVLIRAPKERIRSRNAHRLTLVESTRDREKIALSVEALTKRYGEREALAAVSFDVRQGEVFGLLGLNGAGKTTLISILATQQSASNGDALVLGHSIRDEPQAVPQLIGLAPQEIALYPMLSGIENLRFFGRIYGIGEKQVSGRIEQLLQFVGLQERRDDRVATYSLGMKRRLNLAVALVHRPKLILLDEPTAGVDPRSREEILQLVRRLRDEGSAILYTTHYMDEAEALCDRLCILDRGKVVTVGTLDTLVHKVNCAELIELRGVSARSDLSSIRTLAGVRHVERTDEVVRLFVKRAADLLEPLQKILSRDTSVRLRITPISLQNLFLRLTGTGVHE